MRQSGWKTAATHRRHSTQSTLNVVSVTHAVLRPCLLAPPCSVDGLGALMQPILDAKKTAAAAAAEPATSKQAGRGGVAAPAAASGAGGSSVTAKTLEAAAASGANMLDLSVRLLAGMRWAGLDQLDAAAGKAKKLAVYR